jgi:deoxyribodipyrimidine photo-lyase
MTARPRIVVWFKRDLRVGDHAPLARAANHTLVTALYVIEPEWLRSPECAAQHVEYALACLAELREKLAARGLPLLVRVGSMVEVLSQLHRDSPFNQLLGHEETGTFWSFQRDRAVAKWCRANEVAHIEFAQSGVVRRLHNRAGWAVRWVQRMSAPLENLASDFAWGAPIDLRSMPLLPKLKDLGLTNGVPLPPAGESAALLTLDSFLNGRCTGYRQAMSSPLSAESACSRLSAPLAFGTISMRQVHQATQVALTQTPSQETAYALRGFAGRLRWRCHFMQKLEDEPEIEFRNFARSHDGLRPDSEQDPDPLAQAQFDAWCEGRTGYPMVDACMRHLRATGWLNFRMRAMLVSFAAYHLWLHWRVPGIFLAKQFLDFEPGVHWSQMQMQSGTTGINTLRMYSPAKQARDHDPQGIYICRWVPEIGSPAYPSPIVDERLALVRAKQVLYELRSKAPARAEARAVLEKHGSRKSGLPSVKRRARSAPATSTTQRELF